MGTPHVPTSGDTPKVTPLPAQDIAFREQMRRYILEHSEPWHREHLGRLERFWEQWNAEHFGAEMVIAAIVLSEPSTPRRLGQCAAVSGIGCRSEISIRPSLLTGTHPMVHVGDEYERGRSLLVADVLLHEMIHQWQQEVTGDTEEGYHGHGPTFSAKANEIGARLGLPLVGRTNKKRDCADKGLESPSYWPHIVRPEGYFLGAVVPTSRDKLEEDRPALCESAAVSLARRFSAEEIRTIAEMAVRMKGGAS
ncbi:MAG: SprT-like domain-containing protein [Actinomycetota bacterium]|nr:SprT-like domain-containing protein [Actinomycetota bacterium]